MRLLEVLQSRTVSHLVTFLVTMEADGLATARFMGNRSGWSPVSIGSIFVSRWIGKVLLDLSRGLVEKTGDNILDGEIVLFDGIERNLETFKSRSDDNVIIRAWCLRIKTSFARAQMREIYVWIDISSIIRVERNSSRRWRRVENPGATRTDSMVVHTTAGSSLIVWMSCVRAGEFLVSFPAHVLWSR
jgi:hypothetical protein